MRPDVVIKFMDQFGDVIYNNYNATEAGMIATATPADLRAAPTPRENPPTAPRFASSTKTTSEVPTGEIGQIFVRSGTLSTGTPRARPRTSMTASWRRGTWVTSTRRAGCSWSAATTR